MIRFLETVEIFFANIKISGGENESKGLLWGNSNKIKRFPTDILV
jgi:hypothetical protein